MDSKEVFKDKIVGQLARWKTTMEGLKSNIEQAEVDARAKLLDQLELLHDKRVKAEKILEDISATSQDAWEQVKSGVEQGWTELTRTAKKPWRECAKRSPSQSPTKKFARSRINSGKRKAAPTGAIWIIGSAPRLFGARAKKQRNRINSRDPKPNGRVRKPQLRRKPNPSAAEGIAREGGKEP